jgi:hypothetical protein
MAVRRIDPPEGHVSREEAATLIGRCVRQVDRYIRDGQLQYVQHGRRVWVVRADLDRLDGEINLVH